MDISHNPTPLTAIGKTKAEAEQYLLEALRNAYEEKNTECGTELRLWVYLTKEQYDRIFKVKP